ncbi:C-type lectin domain family 12 member A-like [Hypanus sabinus]|uniref:C-type lectin domain family 12 member A-like n=1 Tax=Hypanus sabinus TaxID=79690 RepID=UPI0028C3A112|nr:C-type lectin domain family 12 member A-like [Hypanus sabinus]
MAEFTQTMNGLSTAAQEQETKQNIGKITCLKIFLLCLVMFSLVAIVAGLSIYVSQIRQSKETCHRNYNELNSTLQTKLSALNSNLSVFKRKHSDIRHQFTEMETKYRSVIESKARICNFWTSSREQTCSKDWVTNTDRCYYVSTFETSFPRAMQGCSNRDSSLLEINSRDKASFVSRSLVRRNLPYWIGQCETGNAVHGLMYKVTSGSSSCSECTSSGGSDYCLHDKHHFICEKSAPCCPDIPEKIQVLCQQPGEPTGIK